MQDLSPKVVNTFSVRSKLFFTFGAIFLLVIVFVFFASYELLDIRLHQLDARTNASTTQTLLLSMQGIEQRFQIDALSGRLGSDFVSTGQTKDTLDWTHDYKALAAPLRDLRSYYQTYDHAALSKVGQVQKDLTEDHLIFTRFVAAVRAAAQASPSHAVPVKVSVSLSSNLGAASTIAATITTDTATRTQSVIDLTIALMIIIAVSFLLVGGALTFVMASAISSPLRSLLMVTRDIAAGDLSKRARILSHDEFEVLANSFNLMADKVGSQILELHAEKAKLHASISSLGVGFILIDKSQAISIVNRAALQMLWPDTDLSTLRSTVDIAALTKQLAGSFDLTAAISAALADKKIATFDNVVHGSSFLKIAVTPITQDMEIIGTVILIDNVTEARVLERSKDEFFSIASHELRTPLTAIKGNAAMIEQYYPEILKDENLKQMVTDVHESSTRLIEIVNDFLDMSRLQQGKVTFKNAPIDVGEIIESTMREYKAAGSKNDTVLTYEKSKTELPKAFADSEKVKQVLVNLVGNAMKFTPNGTITVRAELFEKDQKHYLKVFVTDTGGGIPAEYQSLLFRKFQQAGSSLITRDTSKGTGLGLYISKLITEGMGGQIALDHSEEGKGSVFTFTLPLATAEQLNAVPATEPQKHTDSTTGMSAAS